MRLSSVILLSLFAQGNCYFRSTCNATYAHAQDLCHLATPKIDFKPRGMYVNISDTVVLGNETPTDEALWTGYVKKFTIFAYIGCTPRSKIDENHDGKTWHILADPGLCYSNCQTPFIGLGMLSGNKPVCFCIDKKMLPAKRDLTGNSCTKLCHNPPHNPPGALCGDDGFVSIYEKATLPGELQTSLYNKYEHWFPGNDKKCVVHNVENGQYSFLSPCSNQFRSLCTTESFAMKSYSAANGTPTLGESEDITTWAESMKSCLSRGLLPTYNITDTTSSSAEVTSRVWLSLIWSYTILNSADIHDAYVLQGYVKSTPSGIQLLFESTNETRHALCDKDDEPSRCIDITTATKESPKTKDPWYSKWYCDVLIAVGVLVLAILFCILCHKRKDVPTRETDEPKQIGDDSQCQYVSSDQSERSERSERSEHIYLEIEEQPSTKRTYINTLGTD